MKIIVSENSFLAKQNSVVFVLLNFKILLTFKFLLSEFSCLSSFKFILSLFCFTKSPSFGSSQAQTEQKLSPKALLEKMWKHE